MLDDGLITEEFIALRAVRDGMPPGRGCTVTIGSIPDEVTTTVAARMLNMSRPSLMKLGRDGQIPSHKVGSHTRLHSKGVLAFRRAQLKRQSEAFDELRALEDEWGGLD